MSSALTLSALPCELQLSILQHLSTRRLLCRVTRLSKHWLALVCELVRQRTKRLLAQPGVGIVFEISNPCDSSSRVYALQAQPTGLFDSKSGPVQLPQLSLDFTSSSASFEFNLDDDEYMESFLWSVTLSTHRSIQYRVSPPASPKLLAFDRKTRDAQKVEDGMDRFHRNEFPEPNCNRRTSERELTGDCGPPVRLATRLSPPLAIREKYTGGGRHQEGASEFRVSFEGLRMDAASVIVASEDAQGKNNLTMVFCR